MTLLMKDIFINLILFFSLEKHFILLKNTLYNQLTSSKIWDFGTVLMVWLNWHGMILWTNTNTNIFD